MAQHQQAPQPGAGNCEQDGCADAFAAVAVIAVVIATVVYWLHGMA